MTLKALAEELHVSVMTVYRRAERNDIDIKELRGPDKELTTEGVKLLAALFDDTTPDTTNTTETVTMDATSLLDDSNSEDNRVKVARLEATVDGLRALVAQLQGERDALRAALAAEQEDRAAERRMITGTIGASDAGEGGEDHQQQRRGGLFAWFRRR